jgi:hypothetical protein
VRSFICNIMFYIVFFLNLIVKLHIVYFVEVSIKWEYIAWVCSRLFLMWSPSKFSSPWSRKTLCVSAVCHAEPRLAPIYFKGTVPPDFRGLFYVFAPLFSSFYRYRTIVSFFTLSWLSIRIFNFIVWSSMFYSVPRILATNISAAFPSTSADLELFESLQVVIHRPGSVAA